MIKRPRGATPDIHFEEALSDDWSWDFDVKEVPLDDRPLWQVGAALLLLALIVTGRILYLNVAQGSFYRERADSNLGKYQLIPAPRGLITDRNGMVLAENKPVFSAYLDVNEFLHKPEQGEETLRTIEDALHIPRSDVMAVIHARNLERSAEPMLLSIELTQEQLVTLKEKSLPTLLVRDGFRRQYPEGKAFASILGYIGLPNPKDLAANPDLTGQDSIGKTGLERYYEKDLQGKPGMRVTIRDAKGKELSAQEKAPARIGETLSLTIDGEFQKYFHTRMSQGLAALGKVSGVGLAVDPRNGEVLALINFPTFDNNVFATAGFGAERLALLKDPHRPLFDRAIGGLYSPGSTIKPLVGVAALAEKVIDPRKTIFSPGYLDIPNPYNPDKPTRYLDWRYQGDVDLSSALAQSSDVYFYEVGGGFPGQKGLGITKLRDWWQKFGLDKKTGIDLPGEAAGFLPSPEWKQKAHGHPWVLGDSYNVSIGQGDLQITPIELLNYIAAVANNGKLYRPHLNRNAAQSVIADLSNLDYEFSEVRKGMEEVVSSPLGTGHLLADLPVKVAGKSGTAQIHNNAAENSFFTAYAPAGDPQIAILVLVEDAKIGAVNSTPIAKDVLGWYYEHRIKK
jgi:penicillin-binding protein 2